MLVALLLPIDIAARRLTSLEFFAEGYKWVMAHLKIGNTVQLAMSTGELPVDTTVTVLDHLRTQRQGSHEAEADQANKHPLGKKKVTQAKPSETEIANPNRAVENKARPTAKESRASNPTQATQPEEISMAAKLVEAKRKRQKKNKQPEE
jgi:hypothetical protein